MKKILYVEDEPFLGKIVKESLESRGFDVHLVQDGEKVMSVFGVVEPDICVLDVMLPNKDGFSLGREIREQKADIPIIFLTAKNQTEDVLKGFESGGNDYVRKPFSMEELIVRINNLLQLAQGEYRKQTNTESVSIGQFNFFPEKQILQRNGTDQQLSHRESQLLALLVEAPKSVVERKDILNTIWGNDSFFNSRNLDVYIRKLRSYLEADENVQIITLKGVGYRLVY